MWLVLQDVAERLLDCHLRWLLIIRMWYLCCGLVAELQAIALKVISLEVHMQSQIHVEAVWVPRELMSRLFT